MNSTTRTTTKTAILIAITTVLVVISSAIADAQTATNSGLCALASQNNLNLAAAAAQDASPFVALVKMIDQATGGIYDASAAVGKMLLVGLGTIEICWFIYSTVWQKTSIPDILASAFFKMISLAVILAIITTIGSTRGALVRNIIYGFFGSIGTLITSTNGAGQGQTGTTIQFNTAAQGSAVAAPLNQLMQDAECNQYLLTQYPADIYRMHHSTGLPGLNIADDITIIIATLSSVVERLFAMMLGAAQFMLFLFLAISMVLVVIDSSIMLAAGVFLLGFGASRWTSGIGASYFKYIIAIGFKVLAIQFVAGLITYLINKAISYGVTNNNFDFPTLDDSTLIGVAMLIFVGFVLVINVNKVADTLASGTPSFGMTGAMVETAVTAAAVVGGGAAVAMAASKAGAAGSIKAMASTNSTTALGGNSGGPGPSAAMPKPPSSGSGGSSTPPPQSATANVGSAVSSDNLSNMSSTAEVASAAIEGLSSNGSTSSKSSQPTGGGGSGQSSAGGSGSREGKAAAKAPEHAAAKRIRQASNIIQGVFHSNPILSESEEDRTNPGYQATKMGTQVLQRLHEAATTHGGSNHGFQMPTMHGDTR